MKCMPNDAYKAWNLYYHIHCISETA